MMTIFRSVPLQIDLRMTQQDSSSGSLDYRHCFRKQFTHNIYSKLKSGESINLIRQKGTGRQRLLEDLKDLAIQEGLSPILVNLSGWKHDFKGFVDFLQSQLIKLGARQVQASNQALIPAEHLAVVLSNQLSNHRQILLLINSYDAVLDNPKQRFPKSFFDDLNSLRNKANISLCLVTEYSHLQSQVFYKDDDGTTLTSSLSWLDLEIIDIPRPTIAEVREELNKRIGNQSLWQKEVEQERYVMAIQSHQANYTFLSIVVNSFETDLEQMPSEKRLRLCYDQFKKNYNRQLRKRPNLWEKIRRLVDWGIEKIAIIKSNK